MKIEHVAFNVSDPTSLARWYVEHLGFEVRRGMTEPPYAHFIADSGGAVMIEIYHNPSASVHDPQQVPAVMHLALTSEDVEADRQRLLAAGATAEGEIDHMASGDVAAFLRDPAGLPLQLVKRGESII